jgi:hypothetical protein
MLVTLMVLWFPHGVQGQSSEYAGAPAGWTPFDLVHVRPTGQPLIPVFEGWYPNPDGTVSVSFGYFNMNSEEAPNIALGEDNFIEPGEFDGTQPTHFLAAPTDRGRRKRHESVFTVTVPGDRIEPVVWTIRHRGQTYSAPGLPNSVEYQIHDRESSTSAPVAPTVRFASGPVLRGRGGEFVEASLEAEVGVPISLAAEVELHGRPSTQVTWYPHQGPGEVTFDAPQTELTSEGQVTTMATFNRPGEYVVRITALESLSALVQHCCWTNAYLKVQVTE